MKKQTQNNFDLTVAKICDKKKLVVFCVRYTNFGIEKYILKKCEEYKDCTNRLTLSPHFFQ